MYIDPHVHLRDFKQRHKETIKHGLEVAYNSGVDSILDMPNTYPLILSKETAQERFGLDIRKSKRKTKNRSNDYPFNPYMDLEQLLSKKNEITDSGKNRENA